MSAAHEWTSSPQANSRSPSLNSRSTDEDHTVKTVSSSTSEGTVAAESDRMHGLALKTTRTSTKSGQKARALTPSASLDHPTRRFDRSIVCNILRWYDATHDAAFAPRAYHLISEEEEQRDAISAFAAFRFRAKMAEMSKINSVWKDATMSHSSWDWVCEQVVPNHKSGNADIPALCERATAVTSMLCAACVVNNGPGPQNFNRHDLIPFGHHQLGRILLCDEHVSISGEPDDALTCCGVCLGAAAFGEDRAVFENTDQWIFPNSLTACKMCRVQALEKAAPRLSECLPGLSNSQIRRAFDFSPARQDYLEWGILNAHKLIDIIAEEAWLGTHTNLETLRSNHILRVRHHRRKRSRSGSQENAEIERNQHDPNLDAELTTSDDASLQKIALRTYATHLVYRGHWLSPLEQVQRHSLQTEIALPIAVGSGEEGGQFTIVELPALPPLLNLLHTFDLLWWKSFDEIIYGSMLKLVHYMKESCNSQEQYHGASDWSDVQILKQLENPICWQCPHPDPRFEGQLVVQQVMFPKTAYSYSGKTAARVVALWQHASAPLRECFCAICSRNKRKRASDDDPASSGDKGDEDERKRANTRTTD